MILSEQTEMFRDTARGFARDRVAPHVAAWEAASEFPREAVAEMGALGFLGMLVPEDWDGSGASHVDYVAVIEEVSAADGGIGGLISVQNSVVCLPLLQFGSEEQKERWLKPLARGEMLGGFCLTEPHAGSDASNLKTRARRDGNHWVIDGTKQFITQGAEADVVIVFAATDPAAGKRGISAFLVPTDSEGFTVVRKEHKLGQRHIDASQLRFESVRVPADAMLGEEGRGYRIALANLEGGRIGISAQAIGIARGAYEAALSYAKERESFGKPIFEHQAVAFRLADMATRIEVARQMMLHAASLRDAGRPCIKEASMAKLYASEMAEQVCSDAIQIHGGYGYLEDYPVARFYRDVRVTQIYEGTSDIQRLVIARAIAEE
ncbi:MAG: acyl-CoA dehydrogenase [Rhodospirillaceae bacterium]|nr:acyl-CoA dehydrogenase [Rhodospirillaceae bacterium]